MFDDRQQEHAQPDDTPSNAQDRRRQRPANL